MARTGVPIPSLDPPWPEGQEIAVVIAQSASPEWRRLTHDAAAAAQPGGHSFPLDEAARSRDSTADDLTAFLYRHEDRMVMSSACVAPSIRSAARGRITAGLSAVSWSGARMLAAFGDAATSAGVRQGR